MSRGNPDKVKQTLECIRRIEGHENVAAVVIVNSAGAVVHTTLHGTQAADYAKQCAPLAELARCTVRETDPTDDLQFFRIRTKKYEMIIAPEKEYSLIVLQNSPSKSSTFAWVSDQNAATHLYVKLMKRGVKIFI